MNRLFLPQDSGARSLGADSVAAAINALDVDVELIRTGSRGMYWLEPLLEIETADGRIGFGRMTPEGVADLFREGMPAAEHPECLGLVDGLPWMTAQSRLTTARLGVIDPLSMQDYIAHGGFAGLKATDDMSPSEIVAAVTESGLRGRGGAAFPTGIKWQTVLETPAEQKYVVCNADEGDSGTFVDRMLMEGDPFVLLEGMAIAGRAVGANTGYIYCRAEYPQAIDTLQRAIDIARDSGHISDVHLEVRVAAGAYICGEETSMLESIEGKRPLVRFRPPLPAVEGLFGQPTVVNNVVSLASVPAILAGGAGQYAGHGMDRSRGTLTVQLAGNIARGGLLELPFGLTLREVLEDLGGGTASGRPIKAVQAGGPLGALIPPAHFDTSLDYEAFKAIGAMIGHGGLVVYDDSADLGAMARFAMEFCALESCGKCTPCRVGAVRGVEVIDKIRKRDSAEDNRILLRDLCGTMVDGSLCALGGMAPFPVLSVLDHFPEEL